MTRQQRDRRFSRIREIGCLACRKRGWFRAPDVHHLNLGAHAGQKRIGDEATIGLCEWHHRGNPIQGWTLERMGNFCGPSLKHEPSRFRTIFGSDESLLRLQNELIAEKESNLVGAA